jgi:RNA recognition motif-containing protein
MTTPLKRAFVYNIPFSCTAQEVGEAFSRYGRILECKVRTTMNQRGQSVSIGKGFVEWIDPNDYNNALNSHEHVVLKGNMIKISPARERRSFQPDTIFIPRISIAKVNESKLYTYFQEWNPSGCRIIQGQSEDIGFAFVYFKSFGDAKAGKDVNSEIKIDNVLLRLFYARYRPRI